MRAGNNLHYHITHRWANRLAVSVQTRNNNGYFVFLDVPFLSLYYYKCSYISSSSVFTGFGEYYCICENSSIKPFATPEEAACILINCKWLSCILGNIGSRV